MCTGLRAGTGQGTVEQFWQSVYSRRPDDWPHMAGSRTFRGAFAGCALKHSVRDNIVNNFCKLRQAERDALWHSYLVVCLSGRLPVAALLSCFKPVRIAVLMRATVSAGRRNCSEQGRHLINGIRRHAWILYVSGVACSLAFTASFS